MDPAQLLDLVLDLLPSDGRFVVEDPAVIAALAATAPAVSAAPDAASGEAPVDAVLLMSGEVAAAGVRAPAVIDAAVRRCRPGGWVVVAVPSAVHAALHGDGGSGAGLVSGSARRLPDDVMGMTAAALEHALAERGLDVRRIVAPGAAAGLTGRRWRGREDLVLDTTPGLLDAGAALVAVARTPKTADERSTTFFASIARKIVSSSVLCLTDDRRLLVVFDSFKKGWTLPGGLVDAGENPIEAAAREAWEEGGVRVQPTDLLGVFAHASPDRVNLVYGATPVEVPEDPRPLHDHEIEAVRWVALDAATALLDGWWPRKVRRCLEQPGGTWLW